jgi:outer membrane protein assembly factor BamB
VRLPATLCGGSLALLLSAGAATAAIDPDPVALPRPPLPPPLETVAPSERVKLEIVSSRPRDPSLLPAAAAPPAWAPATYRGLPLQRTIRQPGTVFLVYGADGASSRYLVAADPSSGRRRYAFDFSSYAVSPGGTSGSGYPFDPVVFARQAGRVLYVSTAHLTYAETTGFRNGYVTAVDVRAKRLLWRSPSLVANARTFVLAGDLLVTGYGFTAETDYVYVLDRATGKVLARTVVPTAPETISRHGSRLVVRTYGHTVVIDLHAIG